MLVSLHYNDKAKVRIIIKNPNDMKREVMKKAWMFVKNAGYTMSEALKKAWRMVKFSKWLEVAKVKNDESLRKVEEMKEEGRKRVAKMLADYCCAFTPMKCGLHNDDNDAVTMRGTRLYNAE